MEDTQVFGFFKFSGEIRQQVYEYVVVNAENMTLPIMDPLPCPHMHEVMPLTGTAYLLVSKPFSKEVLDHYYRTRTVHIMVDLEEVLFDHDRVVKLTVPLRHDWDMIRKLDITVMSDPDPADHCEFCDARSLPTYRLELCKSPNINMRTVLPPATEYTDARRYQEGIGARNIRRLTIRFVSTVTYITDYARSRPGMELLFRHLVRHLGRANHTSVADVEYLYGRGRPCNTAVTDYMHSRPAASRRRRSPDAHLAYTNVEDLFRWSDGWLRALLDQEIGYGDVNERIWAPFLPESWFPLTDDTVLPEELGGWRDPARGCLVRVVAYHVWGPYFMKHAAWRRIAEESLRTSVVEVGVEAEDEAADGGVSK